MVVRGGRRASRGVAIIEAARRVAIQRGPELTAQDVIKEAGVSLQTFYRYFPSRDRLVFEVIADWIGRHCERLARAADDLPDPVDRLELYVRRTLRPTSSPEYATAAQFVTIEHWRLHQRFPEEMEAAIEPFVSLLRDAIETGRVSGRLDECDADRAARVMTRTVLGTFHHLAFFPQAPMSASAADDVWRFCFAALAGRGAVSGAPRPGSLPS